MFVAAFYRRLTRRVIATLSQRPHPSGKFIVRCHAGAVADVARLSPVSAAQRG